MEEQKFKYRAVIEFLTLEGISASEIHPRLINVYGDNAPSYATVCRWNNEFKHGRETLHDDARSGRPAISVNSTNAASVKKLLDTDRRLSIRVLSEQLHLSRTAIETIISQELHMSKVCAKWVPRMLTKSDKEKRLELSDSLLSQYDQDPEQFEARFLTNDETWLHHFDPETKQQSAQWKTPSEPTPIKFKKIPSAGKILASIFWDRQGVVLCDFLPRGRTITGTYYADLLHRVRDALKQKRRGALSRVPLLLQDNAPAHTSHVAMQAVRDCGFKLVPHPPYSPDLAPCDFYLFPKLKTFLKGQRFCNDEALENATQKWLDNQSEIFYLEGVRKLRERVRKCVVLNGDYVERE